MWLKTVKLEETVEVGRLETLEEVVAFLETLDERERAPWEPLRVRVERMRTRVSECARETSSQAQGRRQGARLQRLGLLDEEARQ